MSIAASHQVSAGRLDLGSRRAETGTQSTTCLVDGTITNLGALARLGDTGADADPETVVARAYEARGEEILGEILGSWSIVLWDRRRRAGLIAKDPLGGRPVHFHDDGGVVEVASEVADLVDRLGGRPGIDRTAMAHWLARRPLPTASTLLGGVRRLPAGHLLRLGHGRAGVERWWSPCYEAPRPRDRGEAVAVLAEGMAAAVGRAGADAPVGVLLSGGFDSLSVAALMPAPRAHLLGRLSRLPGGRRVTADRAGRGGAPTRRDDPGIRPRLADRCGRAVRIRMGRPPGDSESLRLAAAVRARRGRRCRGRRRR